MPATSPVTSPVTSVTRSVTGSRAALTYLHWPLATDISLLKGTGTPSYSRASSQLFRDFDNRLRLAPANVPVHDGIRAVENLALHSNDFSQSAWVKIGTATVTGTNVLNFPVLEDMVRQPVFAGFPLAGKTFTFSATLSGSGTIALRIARSVGTQFESFTRTITLAATPTRYVVTHTFTLATSIGLEARVHRSGTLTATQVTVTDAQIEEVTNQTNQLPSEYHQTTTAVATRYYTYLNPMTVDGSGVVTDTGTRTPITTGKGLLCEPAVTNKCTCWGIPGADQLGSELASGALTIGRRYTITVQSSGTYFVSAGAPNPHIVGDSFTATATMALDTNNRVKEVGGSRLDTGAFVSALGAGVLATSSNQTVIPNMTCAPIAGTLLSIVSNQALIEASGLAKIVGGYKVYRLDNSANAGAPSYCLVAGPGGASFANIHTISVYAAGGSGRIMEANYWSAGGTAFGASSILRRVSHTAALFASGSALLLRADAGQIVDFIVPNLAETPFLTSEIPSLGAATTRAVTIPSLTVAGNFPTSGGWRLRIPWTPRAVAGPPQCLFSSWQDANNFIAAWSISGTSVSFEKRVAGVSQSATLTGSFIVGTAYIVEAILRPDNTLNLKVDGVSAGTNNTTTLAPVMGTTFQIGNLNGASTAFANFKDIQTFSR